MITVNVTIPRIDVHVHHVDPALSERLDVLAAGIAALQQQGVSLMAGQAESNALLDQINDYTNRLADAQAQQTTVIQEISTDIDQLIADTTDTSVRDRLTQLKTKTAAIADASEAQTQTLKNIAAKHDEPLPPPVEPPPAA